MYGSGCPTQPLDMSMSESHFGHSIRSHQPPQVLVLPVVPAHDGNPLQDAFLSSWCSLAN